MPRFFQSHRNKEARRIRHIDGLIKKQSTLVDNQPVVFIPLTQGKVAVIDFDDFEKVRGVKWYALKGGRRIYAVRNSPIAAGKPTRI